MGTERNQEQEEITLMYYRKLVESLDTRIKNNDFTSKEDLNKYLNKLKNNTPASSLLTDEKILYFLNLYDEYHQELPASLDLQNYKDTKLGEDDYIVGTKTNEVLKSYPSNISMTDEFKQKQNAISSASTTDELANADIVFDEMKKNEKEELNFIPISEAIEMSNISTEVLSKIKFFITREGIEQYAYRVNPSSGIFYNSETKELVEVRKNEETGEYEIYKSGEKQYTNNGTNDNDDPELMYDKDEEKLEYENPKVKRLIKPPENAAFVNNTFIIFIIATFSVLASLILSMIILINK